MRTAGKKWRVILRVRKAESSDQTADAQIFYFWNIRKTRCQMEFVRR
jgi:hypothetical protein